MMSKLCTTEEVGKHIRDRIMDGWMFIRAQNRTLQAQFEEEFYTPGTEKNEGFEIIFCGYGGKVTSIVIAKQTKELQNYMDLPDKEFKSIILIELEKERVGTIFNYSGTYDKRARSDFVYNYFNNLLELMETGKVTREQTRTFRRTPKQNKRKRKSITKSIRHEVFKRDNYRCLECNASKDDDGITLHIDHIIPVSQGGSDELDNLQTLCQDCNLAKSNRAWKGGKQD